MKYIKAFRLAVQKLFFRLDLHINKIADGVKSLPVKMPIAFGNKILVICVFLAGIGVGPLFALTGPKKCHDVCPMKYRVVCALNALDGCLRTFASSCVMRMYNCKYQKDYQILSERACEIITHDELNNILGTLLQK